MEQQANTVLHSPDSLSVSIGAAFGELNRQREILDDLLQALKGSDPSAAELCKDAAPSGMVTDACELVTKIQANTARINQIREMVMG